MLITELRISRFFDVFEYNGPLNLWGCFLCNHPDRAWGFLQDTQPVIEVKAFFFFLIFNLKVEYSFKKAKSNFLLPFFYYYYIFKLRIVEKLFLSQQGHFKDFFSFKLNLFFKSLNSHPFFFFFQIFTIFYFKHQFFPAI